MATKSKKVKDPNAPKAERKPRQPKTPAQQAAFTLSRGLGEVAALDARIAKHTQAIADLQAAKEKIHEEYRAAKQLLLDAAQ